MSNDRTLRVMDLLAEALELAPPDRAAFLAKSCGRDAALRREVESLIAAHETSGSFLEAPILPDEPTSAQSLIGRCIGRYTIRAILATGGMGVVYRAEQDRPRRGVALKLLRPGFAAPSLIRRLEHEAEILGRLNHPCIARVIEAGSYKADSDDASVQPFFAMELIDGQPLTEYARWHALDVEARLRLLVYICDALQHAHLKGVVHRDLKPSNILVDREGRPKILDFGVARLTQSDVSRVTMQTHTGQLLGTLAYMSPEQVTGQPDEIDARSDVYALGVIMYEMMCGDLPHDVSRKSIFEAARIIREEPPPRLRTKDSSVPGDVETIIFKAMDKEKDRRYQSAGELSADIERYLKDEPILARGPSRMYQLRTFARRNRPLVAGVAAAFFVLIAGLIGTMYGLARAVEARGVAEREAARALAAEADAEQRAAELEKVAAFQESQLADIDAELMGLRLRESIAGHQKHAWAQSGFHADEIVERLNSLDGLLAGANFTDIALASLDENIFQRATLAIDEQFDDQPLIRARLLETVANAMTSAGMFHRAFPLQETVFDVRREQLGDHHPDTLASMNRLGAILVRQGYLAEAESYLLEARAGLRKSLGEDHDETISADSNFAALRLYQGRLEEAEEIWSELLKTSRRMYGEDHESTVLVMGNLAQVLRDRGRHVQARQMWEQALAIHRQVHGDAHPHTLREMNNLAGLLGRLGEHEQAKALLDESLRGRRNVLGNYHPSTLVTLSNLGHWHFEQGRYEDAAAHWQEAVKGLQHALGPDHQTTLSVRGNHAALLVQLGQFDEAEGHLRNILDSHRRLLGNDHQETLTTLHTLAFLMQRQGQLEQAESFQRSAVEGRRRLLGDDHISTLTSMNNLGSILRDLGRLDEAESLGAEAVARGRATLPQDHLNLAVYLGQYGQTLTRLQRFAEAEAVLLESHEILSSTIGLDHPRTISTRNALIDMYDTWHELIPDGGYSQRAALWREQFGMAPQ